MIKTAGASTRNVIVPEGIIIGQNLSHDDDQSRPPVYAVASVGSCQSINSTDTAEVVSKGGAIPDQYRESHIRRNNYLSNLLSNRVSDKTNVMGKLQQVKVISFEQ